MSLDSYLAAAPKAELHLHLEGAIRPHTVLELATRNSVHLPCATAAELQEWFQFTDFNHFVEVYGAISQCLRWSEDFELIAYETAKELAGQNCRYAELGFSPAFHTRAGVAPDVYMDGLCRARERARGELGVEIAFIFDLGRSWRGGEVETRRWASYTVDVAIEYRSAGVVGLGLGGPEDGHPPEPFADLFERGRCAGLGSAPHAGEHAGPASVRGAIEALHADRIAHGVRAIEDPGLVRQLAHRQIALDVCPTSNIRLGVYPDLAAHPLPQLIAAGVAVTINTDDPPLFGVRLNDEVSLLADPFGLDLATIDEILLNGVRHSFLPADRRSQMESAFRSEMETLKADHLKGMSQGVGVPVGRAPRPAPKPPCGTT
ncbi:MAG: adenosine deaminase [Chloroflexi bacterium]|nr:adenosine deaminase [Chloroflexota bacterium]